MTNASDEQFNNAISKELKTFDQIYQECQGCLDGIAQDLVSTSGREICALLSAAKSKISLAECWLKQILQTLRKICLHSNTENEAQFLDRIRKCLNAMWLLYSVEQKFDKETTGLYENNFLDEDAYQQNVRFRKDTKPMLWFINEVIKRTTIVSIESPISVLRDSTSTNDKTTSRNLENSRAKCPKAFATQLKCLGLNEMCIFLESKNVLHTIHPLIEAFLVSEEDAMHCLNSGEHPSKKGELTNNTSKMFFENSQRSVWTADFSNMRVKTVDRGEKGSKTKKVAQMLYRIFYAIKIGSIDFGNGPVEFKTEAVSKPFTLASNPGKEGQRKESFPYVCWSRSFDLLDCDKIFDNIDKRSLPWPDFKESINEIFASVVPGKMLDELQLKYLGEMLFSNERFLNSEVNLVTLDKLLHNRIPNLECIQTFWQWLYETIDFIGSKKVAEYWKDQFFCGYISRNLTEETLVKCTEPTMLIRFSSSEIGNLVFSCILPDDDPDEVIKHYILEMKHCQDLSLYQCYMKLCQIYPSMSEIKSVCGAPGNFLTIEAFHEVKVSEKIEKANDQDTRLKKGYHVVDFGSENGKVRENISEKINGIGGSRKSAEVPGTINLNTNSPCSNRSSTFVLNDSDDSRTPNELLQVEHPSDSMIFTDERNFYDDVMSGINSVLPHTSQQALFMQQDSGASSASFNPSDPNLFDQHCTLSTPVEEMFAYNFNSSTDGNLPDLSVQELEPFMDIENSNNSNDQPVYQQLM